MLEECAFCLRLGLHPISSQIFFQIYNGHRGSPIFKILHFILLSTINISHTSTLNPIGWVHVPHPEPPPISLSISSSGMVLVHQPRASCIMHEHDHDFTYDTIYKLQFHSPSNHPTSSLSHRVHVRLFYTFRLLCCPLYRLSHLLNLYICASIL